jgi:hypothetical protein
MGYATAEEIAADCLFETQGNVAEAQLRPPTSGPSRQE